MPTNDIVSFQKKIFFAAYKTSGNNFDGEITYDIADINEGAGFDKTTGKFTAPEGGTYEFTFSGMTGTDNSVTKVVVLKDGSWNHNIRDENAADYKDYITSNWMMKLSQGEEVNLGVAYGKLYVHSSIPVIFTGSLLKLDD